MNRIPTQIRHDYKTAYELARSNRSGQRRWLAIVIIMLVAIAITAVTLVGDASSGTDRHVAGHNPELAQPQSLPLPEPQPLLAAVAVPKRSHDGVISQPLPLPTPDPQRLLQPATETSD
ncbi:MAG: hypothetical protein KJO55_03570, partial [Gammaproteobacteria bacterium]|nr:hypothetical protein [Gammaproteobacteria bacterium]